MITYPAREAEPQRLIGGDPCLYFVNTLNGHTFLPRHEYLHDYRDLVLWGRHANILTANEANSLLKESAIRPAETKIVYMKALKLRESLFFIFHALATGGKPAEDDLNQLLKAWQQGQHHTRLIRSSSGFSLGWDDEPSLDHISRVISASAIKLLTSESVKQIRQCAGYDCDLLFLDASRNHLRRWCAMDLCGNRIKMRRRRYRQKLVIAE